MPENLPEIAVSRTSARSADASPIVLRETTTSRLIFRPVLLNNPNDSAASIHGLFTFQRKSPRDTWEDHSELPLSKLKASEWIRLELKAAELLTLFRGLDAYYALVSEHGLGRGERGFVPAPKSELLRALLQDENQFALSLQDQELAKKLLTALLNWIYQNESSIVAAQLDGISVAQLQQFDAVLALARLERFLGKLRKHRDDPSESYWQTLLHQYSWAIAQLYAIPLMIVRDQVYVGGKTLSNTGGNTADFLYQNGVTGNVVLVEIKTPTTNLVGSIYRNDVVNISLDLAASTLQTLNAKYRLIEDYRSLAEGEPVSPVTLSPRGLLIIGRHADLVPDALRSFELFRNNQRDIDIVTFDELRAKVEILIQLLHKAGT